ncbi:MAG: hypothetical protein IJL67_06910 [Oscillospiraceae bacterium]|nr:hypothetical protein [Oscillospiraceae bacterium]
MLKITSPEQTENIKAKDLREYIDRNIKNMMAEYNVNDLSHIGCIIILDSSEIQDFSVSEMEFVEVLEIGDTVYLHGVKILGDSYGEDTYLPVEVIRK